MQMRALVVWQEAIAMRTLKGAIVFLGFRSGYNFGD